MSTTRHDSSIASPNSAITNNHNNRLKHDTDTLVIIPARWGSSRFPGKPLAELAGKTMLARVYEAACIACESLNGAQVVVSTEDERVVAHAQALGALTCITSADCSTGTDRAHATITALGTSQHSPSIEWVVNLQGDAPLTPPSLIKNLIEKLRAEPEIDVLTPATQLSWPALDQLRRNKIDSPFSGTTVTFNQDKRALWFSKCILPAIRKESELRSRLALSPVWRHIGLYGFKAKALEQYVTLPKTEYEALEGLEQLRLLENNIPVHVLPTHLGDLSALTGVDTPEDAERITQWIQAQNNAS